MGRHCPEALHCTVQAPLPEMVSHAVSGVPPIVRSEQMDWLHEPRSQSPDPRCPLDRTTPGSHDSVSFFATPVGQYRATPAPKTPAPLRSVHAPARVHSFSAPHGVPTASHKHPEVQHVPNDGDRGEHSLPALSAAPPGVKSAQSVPLTLALQHRSSALTPPSHTSSYPEVNGSVELVSMRPLPHSGSAATTKHPPRSVMTALMLAIDCDEKRRLFGSVPWLAKAYMMKTPPDGIWPFRSASCSEP
mmetsp:Transcript_31431/g.82436  ORF Transcript_31431/g.82436 Transcript_31431/m.82436 type:complete len:246 (+) Transcript_31431:560-1297(+)